MSVPRLRIPGQGTVLEKVLRAQRLQGDRNPSTFRLLEGVGWSSREWRGGQERLAGVLLPLCGTRTYPEAEGFPGAKQGYGEAWGGGVGEGRWPAAPGEAGAWQVGPAGMGIRPVPSLGLHLTAGPGLTRPTPQAAEGLHRDAGAAGRNHGRLLAHAVGEQLYHRGDADQAAGDGPGEPRMGAGMSRRRGGGQG